MPCDKFWAVAAKKRTWLRWCCFYLFFFFCDGAVVVGRDFCAAWARFSYGWGILCVEGCPCAMFVLGLLVSLYIDQHG